MFIRYVLQGIDALRREVLEEIPGQVLQFMHDNKIKPIPAGRSKPGSVDY
jgi:hypothetical protein